MNQSMHLAFLWHMHQPDYRNQEGVMQMPWVFLHAIKDYYEMPWLLSLHEGIKATFNLTPTLIRQLLLYKDPLEVDRFLALWIKHPSELDAEQRTWVEKICHASNFDTMVLPLPRYAILYKMASLSDAELIEMELLFILSWCGNYLRMDHPLVQSLIQKGSRFSQQDKIDLLDALVEFIEQILPFYAKLHDENRISLSTTPLNHPILPLLIDMNNAREANPNAPTPKNSVSLRADAVLQVDRAIKLYRETFSKEPSGLWPAEGAVDEQSLHIFKERNIRWIATDEAILLKSLGSSEHSAIYRPYRFNDVTIGFRDHGLSDLIGFTYRFKEAQAAADDFMHHLESIASHHDDSTVFVIVDGENAWEFYRNNAYDFFTALYETLGRASWCQTATMDEVAGRASQTLPRLHPGTWIHGDFTTWSGHPEKNRAWELIFQTKRDYQNHEANVDASDKMKITDHFLAAECSDWFWWYGDDHQTDFASDFDTLFRKHLIAIYDLMKVAPPADLYESIISERSTASFMTLPQFAITPKIEGRESSFFEWLGAGVVDEGRLYSTMDRVRGPVEKIYYGQDDDFVYIALEGETLVTLRSHLLVLHLIEEEISKEFRFSLDAPVSDDTVTIAVDKRVELSIDKSDMVRSNMLHISLELEEESGTVIQSLPGFGRLSLDTNDDYSANWFI